MVDQDGEVVEALAEGRQVDGKDVEAVVEVLSKRTLFNHILERAVGGRDNADVDTDGFGAADPLKFPLLEGAEELYLDLHRQIADLVEKERAAVGELKAARTPGDGSGEGALLVAEELGLEHAGREGRAVDAHEGLFFPRRVDMDGVGDELFAGAGFAAEKDRGRGRRDLLHFFENGTERLGAADDLAEIEGTVNLAREIAGILLELLDEAAVLAEEVETLDRVAENSADLFGVPGFGDVAVDPPVVDRLDEDIDICEGGENDADGVGAGRLCRLQKLEPGHFRHPLVGDDDRDVVIFEELEGLGTALGAENCERPLKVEAEGVEVVLLVVDDEDFKSGGIESRRLEGRGIGGGGGVGGHGGARAEATALWRARGSPGTRRRPAREDGRETPRSGRVGGARGGAAAARRAVGVARGDNLRRRWRYARAMVDSGQEMGRRGHDLALFALGLAVYGWTSSPALGWLDSPEFVAAAAELGVAHSPGHPLPSLLGKLATFVPLGDLVWRANLMSALAAAAALVCLAGAGRELLGREVPCLSRATRSALAAASALTVGFSFAAWSSAVRAEVYALQLFLSAGLLWALLRYLGSGRPRELGLCGLFAGLALANHHFLALLIVLPGAAAVLLRRRSERPSWRQTAATAILGAVGLSALLYLPARAMAHPEVNFGAPSSLARFFWTLSGAAFTKTATEARGESLDGEGIQVAIAMAEAATLPLALLAILGLYVGIRRPDGRREALLLGAVVGLAAAGRALLGFDPETPDHHAYLVVGVAALALLGALGLGRVAQAIATAEVPQPLAGPVAAAALLLLAAVQLATQWPRVSLRSAWASDEVARWELESLPPRSLALISYFQTAFRIQALHVIEAARPDVDVLDRSFLTYPGHAAEAARRFPELRALIDAPLQAGAPTPVALLGELARERPVFLQLHPNVDAAASPYLVPAGAMAAFSLETTDARRRELEERDRRAGDELAAIAERAAAAEEAWSLMAAVWHQVTRLEHHCARRELQAADRVLAEARALAPGDSTLAEIAAACGLEEDAGDIGAESANDPHDVENVGGH